MKKVLWIILINMIIVGVIYASYIKSRRTTAEIPKGANVVEDDAATPDDRVLYGREYSAVEIETYSEEGLPEAYILKVQEVLAMFPPRVARSLQENDIHIVLVIEDENTSDNKAIYVYSDTEESLVDNLITGLCEYTDEVYGISKAEEIKEYVINKKAFSETDPETYEYFEDLFSESERIEEILKIK